MNDLYQAILLDHYKRPRNATRLAEFSVEHSEFNPLCGDAIVAQLLIKENVIEAVSFQAKGCVISVATASMLSEKIQNKSIDEIRSFDSSFVQKLINMTLGPTRLKCALLPLHAIMEGLKKYQNS
jgi:nitrogen fixation NifU-like protein